MEMSLGFLTQTGKRHFFSQEVTTFLRVKGTSQTGGQQSHMCQLFRALEVTTLKTKTPLGGCL